MAKDKLLNGTVLGALFGVLISSSSIGWISSIVTKIVEVLPADYQTNIYKYLLFAGLGAIVGALIDKY